MDKKGYFREVLEKEKIVIPTIQREYVYGIKDEKINNLRSNFLEYLLSDIDKPKSLDVIYGYKQGDRFVPIDGQQRLTILFLIYVYVTVKTKDESIKRILNNFSYEIRSDTDNFVKSLVGNIERLKFDNTPSCEIKDSIWFLPSWEKDITISSMLNTLDDIHKKIEEKEYDINKLKNYIQDSLFFDFFDVGEAKNINPKEVFVKMNSRSLEATALQIFKAWLKKNIADGRIEVKEEYKDVWEKKFDTEWLEVFWNITQDVIEKNSNIYKMESLKRNIDKTTEYVFMRYIVDTLIFLYLLDNNGKVMEDEKQEKIKNSLFKRVNPEKIEYDFDESLMREIIFGDKEKDTHKINDLFFILTRLEKDLDKYEEKLSETKINFFHEDVGLYKNPVIQSIKDLIFFTARFEEIEENVTNHRIDAFTGNRNFYLGDKACLREIHIGWLKAMLWGISYYILKNKNMNNFFSFIRVYRNIIWSIPVYIGYGIPDTELDKKIKEKYGKGFSDLRKKSSDMVADLTDRFFYYHFLGEVLKIITNLADNMDEGDFYGSLINMETFYIFNKGFGQDQEINEKYERQIKDEKRKANLIKGNREWEKALAEAENHWILRGRVGFLLDFANEDLESFKEYYKKFSMAFDLKASHNYLFQRTLLSMAKDTYDPEKTYLIKENEKRNRRLFSFLPFAQESWRYGFSARDLWRKFFDVDVYNEKRVFLKELLDNIKVDGEDIVSQLRKIKDKNKEGITDWKRFFLEEKTERKEIVIRSF